MSYSRSYESGFTLLEVIVALAIFVVSLGSLYATFGASVDRATFSATRSEAAAIAQSVLTESLAKGSYENDSGEMGSYGWSVDYHVQADSPNARSRWQLYTIDTEVSWQHKSKTESLQFTTKRMGPISE